MWNGQTFERKTLKDLGLQIQLGHALGEICLNPQPVTGEYGFAIIDTSGIHNVNLNFCACGQINQSHTTQLLRSRLFPATVVQPRTAATFRSLEMFELLTYEAKTTAWEFCKTLARLTDNTSTLKDEKVHSILLLGYGALIRITRIAIPISSA